MRTYDIGTLKVWADPVTGAIRLGNAAAAQAGAKGFTSRDEHRIGSTCAPRGIPDFEGVFAPLGIAGRVVHMRLWGKHPAPEFVSMLAEAETTRTPDTVLDVVHAANGQRTLWRDGSPVLVDHPENGIDRAFDPLGEMLIAACGPDRTAALLHGAAVRWCGATLLLAGRSGAGKSTLAAALCADGGAYVSDDTLVLRASDGAAMPVLFRPSFKAGSWPMLEPLFPDLARQTVFMKNDEPYKHLPDAPRVQHPTPLDAVIFPLYAPEATPKLVPLDPAEMLLMLAKDGFWTTGEVLGAALDALPMDRAFALRHDGTDTAMDRLREIVERCGIPA